MKRITALIVAFYFLSILVGCAETVSTTKQEPESSGTETPVETSLAQTTTPESNSNPTTNIESVEPILLEELSRNCQPTERAFNHLRRNNFENTGLSIGQRAVNFALEDTQGAEYQLSRLLVETPVVMIFGSFTCPPFGQRIIATEEMQTYYDGRVRFIIIYIIEAHPIGSACPYTGEEWTTSASRDKEGNPLTQPSTYQERVAQSTQMVRELGITIPVLIDEMDNPVWCTYGPAPNIAYLIDTDGKIVAKQGWYKPELMKTAIEEYLDGQ